MSSPLSLDNIQGDVLPSLPKKSEAFFFFAIINVKQFTKHLHEFVPHVTTGTQVKNDRSKIIEHKKKGLRGLVPIKHANISFSKEGLQKLGLNQRDGDKLGDGVFDDGMLADAKDLGDNGVDINGAFEPAWDSAFANGSIDGVIVVAGDCDVSVKQQLETVEHIFHIHDKEASVEEVETLFGRVRPGSQGGHEHFGFEDGISNPAVAGIHESRKPGQNLINPGVILLGRDGDANSADRPAWALDGTFLAFRKLAQLVPEFDDFLEKNALPVDDPSLPADHGKELLGARLVGRWKSGAPVAIATLKDDPALAKDKNRNNNFDFSDDIDAVKCPWAAHIRKTNPRFDLLGNPGIPEPGREAALKDHLILRRGIPYGPEVTHLEKTTKKTKENRGLLFVAYQSDLSKGFQFVQKQWANNQGFLFSAKPQPGFDPIIGQNSDDTPRTSTGISTTDKNATLDLGSREWVVSHGGAYFFTPSIPALRQTIAAIVIGS